MKKLCALCSAFLFLGALTGCQSAKCPFAQLKAEEIEWISLFAVPPGVTMEIRDPAQVKEIAAALSHLSVGKKDPSGKDCPGQLIQYTIQKSDGSTVKVGALQPYVFLDGVCYRTSDENASETLARLGNRLLE